MKSCFPLIMVVMLILSCDAGNEKKTPTAVLSENRQDTARHLAFETKAYVHETDAGPAISIAIPYATAKTKAAEKINQIVFEAIDGIIGEEQKQSADYEALMADFIAGYHTLVAESPINRPIGWEALITGKIVWQSPTIINIFLEVYTMTGGAHGNTICVSLIFDAGSGNLLTIEELINDIPAFTAFAERQFRETFDMAADQSINATGLMFDQDKFTLPENSYFTDEGLVLYYNTYEIAAYVEGAKKVLLPYAEVRSYLKMKIP